MYSIQVFMRQTDQSVRRFNFKGTNAVNVHNFARRILQDGITETQAAYTVIHPPHLITAIEIFPALPRGYELDSVALNLNITAVR
jgi:hypothetical protein